MTRNASTAGTTGKITRRRALRAAAAMGALTTAGCIGGDDDEPADDADDTDEGQEGDEEEISLEVTGWGEDVEQQIVQNKLERFSERHDGIEAEYNPQPDEYARNIQTQIGAGDVADVFYVDASDFAMWAAEDVLLELDEYIEEHDYDVDDIIDPLIEHFTWEGSILGIPKDWTSLGMHYNEEMFSNAGYDEFPETWSEFREALEAIQDEGEVDYPMQEFDDGRIWWAWLRQNGGQILTDDGEEAVVASDGNVEALEFLAELFEDDLCGRPSETGLDWHGEAVGSESVACAALGAWGLPHYEEAYPEADEVIDVEFLPYPEDGEQATVAYTVSYSSSIHTDYPEEAAQLIFALTDDEGMTEWAEEGLALSARESHEDIEYYEEHPRRQRLLEYGDYAEVDAYGPHNAEITNTINSEIEGVIAGGADPRDALERAEDQINTEVL